jgi:ribosomal protein S18 acetylase RimI-like enzyme
MGIERVPIGSPLFAAVFGLYRRESSRLGFFPRGAFAERAERGQLFACLLERTLAGFVCVRLAEAGKRLTILHLAVDRDRRGLGIARRLIEHLPHTFPNLEQITLTCRIDYPAHQAWPRLGFVAVRERPGRGGRLADWVWRLND